MINPLGFNAGNYTVLHGYIDESKNDNVFCLSCLIGKGQNWQSFQSDFDQVIAARNRVRSETDTKQLTSARMTPKHL